MKKETLPFIEYYYEDKSKFPFASEVVDERSGKEFIDPDNNFRVGDNGGFLMNIDFVFRKTERFTEAAQHYKKHGKYTLLTKANKKAYHDFWEEETRRRKQGFTANCKLYLKDVEKYDNAKSEEEREALLHPVRITGDHYHFLNYGRLRRTPNKEEKAELESKGDFITNFIEGFPRFWDGHFWNFHSSEFAQRNNYNLFKGKARGKGYSYITGNSDANLLNLFPKATVVLLAYEEKYLVDGEEGTAVMLKTALDWMENKTYWKRGVAKEVTSHLVLGYKDRGSNEIKGWRSRALSFPIKQNESAAIGKRARRIRYEESGYCPNLQDSLDVTLSSTEVGLAKVGYVEVYGTAGTKTNNWQPFANGFFNPGANKAMPFENVWDKGARAKTCGFFHPQVWNLEPYMDVDGNSHLEEAFEADKKDKLRAYEEKTLSDWIVYVGQRANTPGEAFRGGVENIFSSAELDFHKRKVETDSDLQYYRDGMIIDIDGKLQFKTNRQLIEDGMRQHAHPYIDEVPFDRKKDLHGAMRMFYAPFKNREGVVPDNLYVILADPVRKDKDNKTLSLKNSLNAFYVVMLPNTVANSRGDIIVASFVGRPSQMSDANRILLKMCKYYNAKVLVEATVGTIIPDFKGWGERRWLMRDPTGIIDRAITAKANAPYGIQVESKQDTEESLMNLKDFIYATIGSDDEGNKIYRLHYIRDIGLLRELQQYNESGNFDRISAMRLYPYARMYYHISRRGAKEEDSRKGIAQVINLYGIND